jgi:hypothetical protein
VLLIIQPALSIFILAFGAMPIAAGVIAVQHMFTIRATIGLSTQSLGTATLDISHGPQVAEGDPVSKFLAILLTMLAEDIRQLNHNNCSITWLIDSIAGTSTF